MTRLSLIAVVLALAATAPAMAADPTSVQLPSDPAALDHACMAVLWSELSEVSEGYDPQYSPPQINDAIKPWTDDASAREGISPEDEGSTQATMTALEKLTGNLDLYLKQVAYCVDNPPPAKPGATP